jgi:two-component system nitrogen regulation response regulator GlnG
MEIFEKLHRIDANVPIILMTGNGTAGVAIEAMQRGAFEYVLKPLDPDLLIPLVEQAFETRRMTRTSARIATPETPTDSDEATDFLIGNCPAMQEIYRSIGRVARQDVTVLVLGESGTGKEVVARAIYQYSSRSSERFLAINCAAIPEQLLESELFGHEKGSFTGADRKRPGKFELCKNGTLFLDEIGDMSPLMQTKILRVLQEQTFERVGGSETIKTGARVIAATNRDLGQAIKEREFREDLYYRLNVYTIQLPPLRERGEDIPLLAQYFLRQFARELQKDVKNFTAEAMRLMAQHRWPGNVRELQSAVKHALLQTTGTLIAPSALPDIVANAPAASISRQTRPTGFAAAARSEPIENVMDFGALTRDRLEAGSEDIYRELVSLAECQILKEVLQHTEGNLTHAAKRLGVTRSTLRTRMEILGLNLERTTRLEHVK